MIGLEDLQKDLQVIKQQAKDEPKPEADKEKFPFLRNSSCNKYPRFSRATQQFRENSSSSVCQLCHKEYKHKYVLNSHMKVVHNIRPHRCKECGDSFDRIRDLKIHIEIAHLNCTKTKKYQKDQEFIEEQLQKQKEYNNLKNSDDDQKQEKKKSIKEFVKEEKEQDSEETLSKKLKTDNSPKEDSQEHTLLNKSQDISITIDNISQQQTNELIISKQQQQQQQQQNTILLQQQPLQLQQLQQQLLAQQQQQQYLLNLLQYQQLNAQAQLFKQSQQQMLMQQGSYGFNNVLPMFMHQ